MTPRCPLCASRARPELHRGSRALVCPDCLEVLPDSDSTGMVARLPVREVATLPALPDCDRRVERAGETHLYWFSPDTLDDAGTAARWAALSIDDDGASLVLRDHTADTRDCRAVHSGGAAMEAAAVVARTFVAAPPLAGSRAAGRRGALPILLPCAGPYPSPAPQLSGIPGQLLHLDALPDDGEPPVHPEAA